MLRRIPRPLALLLCASAVLMVAWAFINAPFQGPDEPAHYSYAEHLAETGHKPSVLQGDHPESSQGGAAIGFFNLDQLAGVYDARPAWTKLEKRRFDPILKDAPTGDGAGPNPIAKNPPLYYAYEVVPYDLGSIGGDIWTRLIVMRLSTSLLVLAAVVFTWLAAAELFAATFPRLVAAGSVGLLPQLTSLGATINADAMLVAVWSAFTFAAVRLVRRGPSIRRLVLLTLLAGASLLTHGRGTAIAPAFVLVLLIVLFRHRRTARERLRWLVPGAVLLICAYAVYRAKAGTGAYGGEVVLAPSGGMSLSGFISTTWQFYFPRLPMMPARLGPSYGFRQVAIESFFGRFATLEIAYPAGLYSLIKIACVVGLGGLVAAVATRWSAVRARWAEVAALAAIAVSMIGLLHLASYRSLVGSNDPLITGRYVLPLVAVFGLTVAFVISSARPRTRAVLGTLVLSSLLALNLGGLMLSYYRFYG
jgi:hypothetical protein